jgi:hypothetical protein
LPTEYYQLQQQLTLARQTWQTYGIGLGVTLAEMDDYEKELIKLILP